MPDPWYEIDDVDYLPSPSLLVYPARVRANLRRMLALVGGEPSRLRPHVKTHKMPEVIRLQHDLGIVKFKCATIAEAEMVARVGPSSVLVAYPLVGPNVERFLALARAFPDSEFLAVADDATAIDALARAGADARRKVEVLLELDDGMSRTGVAPGDEALALYRRIAESESLRPGGLHVYDGHIRDEALAARSERVARDWTAVREFRDRLAELGLPVPRIVTAGSPTFPVHARSDEREVSPGTTVFWDHNYGTRYPEAGFEPAALVLTRVVSKPGPNRLCLDLGSKAVSADTPLPRAHFLNLPEVRAVAQSEEHLVLECDDAASWPVGAAVYALPFHICPTVALHDEAYVIEHGRSHGTWEVTARRRRLTI